MTLKQALNYMLEGWHVRYAAGALSPEQEEALGVMSDFYDDMEDTALPYHQFSEGVQLAINTWKIRENN